ncbi:MAG: tetratricopeptide repeat-containing protein, partial [Blastocatellia bacterium]
FFLRAVAGIRDEFVPRESSVDPFPADLRAFAEGNHVEMVKPATVDRDASRLVFTWLSPSATRGLVLPAGVKGEPVFPAALTGKLVPAVAALLGGDVQRLGTMTEPEIRQAAFAYEAQGAQEQAIVMLKQVYQRSTDLTGMLAGRLKRRWLADPDVRKDEGERATTLYFEAYNRAHKANDHAQASYNGINYAFMTLALHEDKQCAAEIAASVLEHCKASTNDEWKMATMGEAYLYQSQTDDAVASYREALTQEWTSRDRDSMQKQAIWATRLLEDEIAEARVESLFRKV